MKLRILFLHIFLLILGTGCQTDPTLLPTPTATQTPSPPTETPIPVAVLVNGDPVYLEQFEDELARFQDARGTDLATNEVTELVLDALVDRTLLAQGARENGYTFDDSMIDEKIDQLIMDLGEESSLQTWLDANHYTLASFRDALAEESLASEMVRLIVEGVSISDVHAHALHILVASQEDAQQIHDRISAGAEFSELAVAHSLDLSTRPAGGDLGWFARGTLTIPEIEVIIFELQPGDLSDVIASALGFHIVQLIELNDRPLSFQLLEARREQAVSSWLSAQREIAEIEIHLVP